MRSGVNEFLIRDLKRTLRSGEVLDLPCGTGRLSRQLRDEGFIVTSADLFPDRCLDGERRAVRADMNESLPFADDRYDGIVCQEGIEHLQDPLTFVGECARVLRSGGFLWITTPNFMDLSGRLSYFLTGMKSFGAGFPNEETTAYRGDGDELFHGHAFTLPFFQIRYFLRLHGFGDIEVSGLGRSALSFALYPFVRCVSGPLIDQAFRGRRGKARRDFRRTSVGPELCAELRRVALSRELLCHRKICVRARLGQDDSGRKGHAVTFNEHARGVGEPPSS